ncbi:C40 family peptidase [Actinocatenispora rupis]|uniref:C40 family peptidase n=1 Tax=Actinocatenispora rupis TaxID=519421 RepID=UPI001942175B|nr:C40 family peptidase [Actinocatenispora rupis]
MTTRRTTSAQRTAPAAGQEAIVAVPVATVWTGPDAVRAVDRPAVADLPDVRRWVSAMSKQQLLDLDGRTETQLLLGERVLVEQVDGDWARVVAVEQPSGKDERGYPGVVRLAHLAVPDAPARGRQIVVDATATALCDEPNGDVVLPGVVIGTSLTATGRSDRGWLPVSAPAHDTALWVREADVAPAPTSAPSAKDLLAVAERLIDVPYVWGGLSAYGIDCSGLVHLAHRRLGVKVPRDADDQALVGEAVEAGTEQPGDLYFFARAGRAPHHVGIVAAATTADEPRQMLHASGQDAAGRVVNEPMTDDRTATLTGARRTLS